MKYKIHKLNRIHFKINSKVFWALSVFLIITLIGVWVFQLQLLAHKSGLLSYSQQRLVELSDRTSKQGLYLSSQDIVKLDKIAQSLGFEKIDKVYYIRAAESTVLAR
jgi:uncharacterized membrane protein (Fun14 family)